MKKKVLFIEDDSLIIKLYTTRLNLENISIVPAEDGKEGLEKFNEEHPDLVVLDIMLPKISGVEVLEKIRSQDKKIPILVYSVLSDKSRMKNMIFKGATEFLVKTDITPQKLVEKIKSYLT